MAADTSSETILSVLAGNTEAYLTFQLEHNKKFLARTGEEPRRRKKRAQRDTTPKYIPSQEEFRLRTDVHPRDLTKGWCFGSDSSRCDILLGLDHSRGVSGLHFEVNHNWRSFAVLITNRSRNPLTLWLPNQDPDEIQEGEPRALLKGPCLIRLDVGLLRLILEIPVRKDPSAYDRNLRAYYEKAVAATPLLGQLDIRQRSNPTPVVKHHRYYQEMQLGRGAHARVFSAVDGFTGDVVAIKTFYDNIPNKTVEDEVQILKRLNHNNIVHFIDYVPLNRMLVMEYAAHGTLAQCDLISRPQIYRLATQLTSALSYLHDQDITHRDVKPANILIASKDPHFDCKLADFSVSSEDTNLATFCGTPMYHAPEVKDKHYSKLIDIWSLGVVLIEKWCDWYPDFVYHLYTDRNTFLPDTVGPPSYVIDARREEVRKKIEWTDALREKWISWVRSQLQKETDKTMSKLFLNMFEVDPRKRFSAAYCHHYLQFPEVRDLYESRSTSSESDVGSGSRPSKKRKHSDVHASEVKVRFRHFDQSMSATDLWHASGKRNWPLQAICCRYKSWSSNGSTYVSYQDGMDLAARLKLRDSSLRLLKDQAHKEPRPLYFSSVLIPSEALEVIPGTHKIVHIWPPQTIINAMNIMDCGNVPSTKRYQFLKSQNFLNTRVIKTPKMQGRYIGYIEGLRLCKLLNLPTDTVQLAMDEGWLGPVLEVRKGQISGVGRHQDAGTGTCGSGSQGSDVKSRVGDDSDKDDCSDKTSNEGEGDDEFRQENDEDSGEGSSNQSSSSHEDKGNQKDATIPVSNYSTPILGNSPLQRFVPSRDLDLPSSFELGGGSFGGLGSVPEMVETEAEDCISSVAGGI